MHSPKKSTEFVPRESCTPLRQHSDNYSSFATSSRMLLKYLEVVCADTLQDGPSLHGDSGALVGSERHESSLCLSRKGLSQIARIMFWFNLVYNQIPQAHPRGALNEGGFTRSSADMSLARRAACDTNRELYVSTVIIWRCVWGMPWTGSTLNVCLIASSASSLRFARRAIA